MQRPRNLLQDFDLPPPPLGADGPVEIDIGGDPTLASLINGASLSENPDGSSVIDFNPQAPGGADPQIDFSANLATVLDSSSLSGIGAELVEAIDDDVKSRSEWESTLAEGLRLMGTKIELRTKPFNGACGVYDPLMSEAVIRFWATSRAELLPAGGPVKVELVGATEGIVQFEQQADRVKAWMNLYLTELAPEYYPDMGQMLMWLGITGSMFKKVYQDPIAGRPVAPFIMPQDFIAPYSAVSVDSAPRLTQVCHMTRRDIKLRQIKGHWLDIPLAEPELAGSTTDSVLKQAIDTSQGVTAPSQWRGDEIFDIYETEVDLDLSRFANGPVEQDAKGLPLPYRVTIDKVGQKILAIHRNWRKGDEAFLKRSRFVQYKLLPGTGFYGFGYAHILGNSAKAATSLTRQTIDAQTLSMFPGGLRVKGMRFDSNNAMIGPTEFREIDTGGLPINQAVMTMPYKEISNVPLLTLQFVTERAQQLAGTLDIAVGEGRQDAPVGTTVALMENAAKITSSVLKDVHVAHRRELKMFAELFGEYLPDEPYPFPVPGGEQTIMRADFTDQIDVIPVSDPNITTQTQRIVRAEAKLRLAMQAPQIHNIREAYKQMYEAMGEPEQKIAMMLPEPQQAQPMDPLSENQAAITGGQLKAGPAQDHQAHIDAHTPLGEIPAMQAHIAEHMALQMRQQVERILGTPLPPAGTPLPPEIENQIALLVAKAMKVWKQEQGESITPDQIVMAQLQQEAQKIANQVQIAKGKDAVAAYKARLDFQSKEADRKQRAIDNMVSAASGAADNQVPPTQYVHDILEIGKKAADIAQTEAKTDAIRNPPKKPANGDARQ